MNREAPRPPVRTEVTSSLWLKTKRCFVLLVGLVAMAIGMFLFIHPFNEDSPVLMWVGRLFLCGGGLFMIVAAFRSPRHVDAFFKGFLTGM
jgi:uncharacterized membrane protein HdeD (DUF308 family)